MIYIIPTDTCFGIACAISDVESYNKIYEIKLREKNKPLAIMVESFDWLQKYTSLNQKQILFLQSYSYPFTVLTDCSYIQMMMNLEQEDFLYSNKEQYKKIAFRVANNEIQKKLISEIGPIFLTSANLSGMPEIYSMKEIEKQFQPHLSHITLLGGKDLNIPPNPASDIFEFIGESEDIRYKRKNERK